MSKRKTKRSKISKGSRILGLPIMHKIQTESISPPIVGMSKVNIKRFVPTIPVTVPKNVVRGLMNKGYTQAQIARSLGVSRFTVGSWAIGRRSPNPQNLAKLNRFYSRVSKPLQSKIYRQIANIVKMEGYIEVEIPGLVEIHPSTLPDNVLRFIWESSLKHFEFFQNEGFDGDVGSLAICHIVRAIDRSDSIEKWSVWFDGYPYDGKYKEKTWERTWKTEGKDLPRPKRLF